MASDCTYAGDKNSQGQLWCTKKNIYVSGLEKDSCSDYEKVQMISASSYQQKIELNSLTIKEIVK